MSNINYFFDLKENSNKNNFSVSICQDYNKLSKISEFTYDINDYNFIKYFQNRTGIILDSIQDDYKKVYNSKSKVNKKHELITKQRIQDCWRIYNYEIC